MNPRLNRVSFFPLILLLPLVSCAEGTLISDTVPGSDEWLRWTGIFLLAAYSVYTCLFLTLELLRKKKALAGDGPSPARLALTRGLTFLLLTGAGVYLALLFRQPLSLPPRLVAGAWFFLAWLLLQPIKLIWKKPLAALPALALADAGLVFVLYRLTNDFAFLPDFTFLAALGILLHAGLISRVEIVRLMGSRRAAAAAAVCAVVLLGGIAEHRSILGAAALNQPGRVQRLRGTEGRIISVWVHENSGTIFYINRDDRTKVHAVSYDGTKRYFFQDTKESFVTLRPGYGPDTVLAASESAIGKSAILLKEPDLAVQATFATMPQKRGLVYGPPTLDALIDSKFFFASAMQNGKYRIISCAMPMDGSAPKSDMGQMNRFIEPAVKHPGPLQSDAVFELLFTADRGSLLDRSSALLQFNTEPLSPRKTLKTKGMIYDLALSHDKKTLYVAFGLDKVITYFATRSLTPSYKAPVHIHPTTILTDSKDLNLYIGSAFDGAVQAMRLRDGNITRPIYVGPNLRGLALDENRNLLYAATESGVVRIDLSLIPMPSGAAIINDQLKP